MAYYFNKSINADFESASDRIKEELMKEGFGALTEINLHEKFKDKLNKDFRKYRIIGACNPKISFEVLQYDDKVGTMLPCSVVVQETENGEIDVSVADPVESLKAIPDENVKRIVATVRDSVKSAIERL